MRKAVLIGSIIINVILGVMLYSSHTSKKEYAAKIVEAEREADLQRMRADSARADALRNAFIADSAAMTALQVKDSLQYMRTRLELEKQ